ncbi:hypothetical protein SFRURICE_002726 [Spodoptera frugiperda]|nr:hypothetical protein SFRURICE_002726 [Spodoptera frugiperda]
MVRGRGFDPFDPRLLSIKLDVELSLNGDVLCYVDDDTRCVWLPPIKFIDTHTLALVETYSAKICFLYENMLWMVFLFSIHHILKLRILLAQLLSGGISYSHRYIASLVSEETVTSFHS